MVTRADIQATCDDIVREFAPLQVILFGSYAYGTPTDDSDVDLLVVMDIPESETSRQAGEILQRVDTDGRGRLCISTTLSSRTEVYV